MKKLIVLIPICLLILTWGCKKNETSDSSSEALAFVTPSYFPEPTYSITTNPIKQEVFDLGKSLFYDGILSADGSISCSSCHLQAQAFVQVDHDFSHGIYDQLTKRNTPALQNLAWNPYFFWHGGVPNLDLTSISPIENELEMGEKMSNVINKLRKHATYPTKFKKAFGDYGDTTITIPRFLKALSQFMVMLVSADSKYDQVVHKKTATFTSDEQAGYTLFQQKCNTCHPEPLFTDSKYRNNGIQTEPFADMGRNDASALEADKGKFKTPSLRNVELTYPYMHDGRFTSLDKVLEHYNSGVKTSTTLAEELKQESPYGIRLSSDEKTKLIAFLKTLTDNTFIRDSRFSE